MRGMFAVAIWDAPRQRLVLARDRVGKKPLYYIEHDGELLFGSETKAILAALDEVPGGECRARCSSFFTFGYVAGDDAVFEGMRRLEPGTALTIDVDEPARSTIEPFWTLARRSASRHACPKPRRSSALRAELTEAVRIRLRSDVPLGAFLSGGMDSAAVLALMAQHVVAAGARRSRSASAIPTYDELDEARSDRRAFRRRSSRADRHARLRPRRRDAGRALRRAVRRRVGDSDVSTSPSLRAGTSRSA